MRVHDLMHQPLSFHPVAFTAADAMLAACRQDMIEQCMNRYKPPVHFAHPFHKTLKALVELAVFDKTARQVRVHNAGSTFTHQPVLVFFTQH